MLNQKYDEFKVGGAIALDASFVVVPLPAAGAHAASSVAAGSPGVSVGPFAASSLSPTFCTNSAVVMPSLASIASTSHLFTFPDSARRERRFGSGKGVLLAFPRQKKLQIWRPLPWQPFSNFL
jgi:hypothetical protein